MNIYSIKTPHKSHGIMIHSKIIIIIIRLCLDLLKGLFIDNNNNNNNNSICIVDIYKVLYRLTVTVVKVILLSKNEIYNNNLN